MVRWSRYIIVITLLAVASACVTFIPMQRGESEQSYQVLRRGQALAHGLAACGFCHGATKQPMAVLAGGQLLHDRYGTVVAPNITPHSSGIAQWTVDELVRVIRFSIAKDGSRQSREMHKGYEWMSEEDVLAIIAYLRASEPIATTHSRRTLSFWQRNISGFSESWIERDSYVPEVSTGKPRVYGRYLAKHVGRCATCHDGVEPWFSNADPFTGGRTMPSVKGLRRVPALAGEDAGALQEWTKQDFLDFLQGSRSDVSLHVDADLCPTEYFKQAPLEQRIALAEYLAAAEF